MENGLHRLLVHVEKKDVILGNTTPFYTQNSIWISIYLFLAFKSQMKTDMFYYKKKWITTDFIYENHRDNVSVLEFFFR